jgi:hypothetical protein
MNLIMQFIAYARDVTRLVNFQPAKHAIASTAAKQWVGKQISHLSDESETPKTSRGKALGFSLILVK